MTPVLTVTCHIQGLCHTLPTLLLHQILGSINRAEATS